METLDELIPMAAEGARMWAISQQVTGTTMKGIPIVEWKVEWVGLNGMSLSLTGHDLHKMLRIFLQARTALMEGRLR